MLTIQTKADIEKISHDLLKQSKSLDIFPTPVDSMVNYAEFYVNNGVDLSVIDSSFLAKFTSNVKNKFNEAIGLVRGILDRKEKIIYLDMSQRESRKSFVKLHELGHGVLSWQNEILQHLDDDEKLDDYTNDEFEAEANYFASATLFQNDRFTNAANKLNLEIKTPMHLSQVFGGSVHATLRRYVETSSKKCALIVLSNVSEKGKTPKCNLRNFIKSPKFEQYFGDIILPQNFGYTWEFAKDFYFNRKYREDGSIQLSTSNGPVNFNYHYFNNTYNAFVLLFPNGEQGKASKTKIIYHTGISK